MFFYISHNEPVNKKPLTEMHKVNNYCVQLDKAWHRVGDIFFKGYAIGQTLKSKVQSHNFSTAKGNYVILDFSQTPSIYCDDSRSFPLFFNNNTLTNINDSLLEPIYFDGSAINENNQWKWCKGDSKNSIQFDPEHKTYNKTEIVDLVCNYLITVTQQLDTDLPIIAANSPGVDSTLVRSAFDYCNLTYSLGDLSARAKSLYYLGWGYKQLHITDTPHMQLTGFCGDELLLRNPLYCQWLLDYHNIDLVKQFDNIDYCYMKGFFNAKYRDKLLKRDQTFKIQANGFNHTANVAVNDFQMWHFDHTITFTPLRNLDLATECLYADPDTILDQVMHAGISKAVIEKLNAKNLASVEKHKNTVIP